MKFQIVSHACLDIQAKGKRLIVDPWLNEPTYWSSWWHCPPPIFGDDIFGADYVYITHWHFDHFDPRTLKKFSKSTTIVVPKFPISGLPSQLADLGFDRVVELPHGKSIALTDGFTLTSYQDQLPGRQRRGRRGRRHGALRPERLEAAAVALANFSGEVSEDRLHAAKPLAGVVVPNPLHVRRSGRPAAGRRAYVHGRVRRGCGAAPPTLCDPLCQRHLSPASRGARREPLLGLRRPDEDLLRSERGTPAGNRTRRDAGRQQLVA